MTCSERGWFPPRDRQRRANRRGHAVLLAQNLENPFGVYHMAHTGLLRRRRRPSTFSITYPHREDDGCLSLQPSRHTARRWSTRPTFNPTPPSLLSYFYPAIHHPNT